jgi:WD40 repeat protein
MWFRKISRLVAVTLLAASLFALLPASTSAQEPTVKMIPVTSMMFASRLSPDGKTLAMAEDGNMQNWGVNPLFVPIHLLNLETGELTGLIGAADYAQGIAFSPDGTRFAASYGTGYLYVWDLASGTVMKQISTSLQTAGRMFFLPDNKTLVMATGFRRPEIWLWDTDTGYVTAIYLDHPTAYGELMNQQNLNGTAGFALSQDGTTLALATMSGGIELWNLADGSETVLIQSADTTPTLFIRALAFTPDGSRLVYYHSQEGLVHVLDVATGQEALSFAANTSVFALSPDGETIVWADRDANALMMTSLMQPGDPQAIPLPTSDDYEMRPQPPLGGLFFTPDGRQIVFSGFISTSMKNVVAVVTLP